MIFIQKPPLLDANLRLPRPELVWGHPRFMLGAEPSPGRSGPQPLSQALRARLAIQVLVSMSAWPCKCRGLLPYHRQSYSTHQSLWGQASPTSVTSVRMCLQEMSTCVDQGVIGPDTGPWRNSSPSPGLFALLKNERGGLVDFWCPADTNILEYSRGWHTCPEEAKPNTPNLRPRGQLGSGHIPDHASHSGHSGAVPHPQTPRKSQKASCPGLDSE